jgi:hypothetical protein
METVKLRDVIDKHDYTKDVLSYHTGRLNKEKIDAAIEAIGITVPLPTKVSFHLYKMNDLTVDDVWIITWLPLANKYAVEKLTLK